MEKIAFYFRKNVLAQGDFSLYYRFATYFSENFDVDIEEMQNRINAIIEEYMISARAATSKKRKDYYEHKIKKLQSLLDSEMFTKRSR